MKPFYAPGRYVCRVEKHDIGTTSKGNVQLVVQFRVIGRPNPDDPEQYYHEKTQLERRYYRVLNENTIEWATEDLKALGFRGDSFEQLSPNHPQAWSFEGVELDMFCNHESDQKGELREVWFIARTGGSLVQEAADVSKIRELDYVFKKQLQSLKGGDEPPAKAAAPARSGKGKPAAAAAKPAAATVIDDGDVPF